MDHLNQLDVDMNTYRITIEVSAGKDEERGYHKWEEAYEQTITSDGPLITNVVATVNNLVPQSILKLRGVEQ